MEIDYILLFDILGVIAFSISGVLLSMKKKMDVFGIFIIAFVTAVGGGTLRDLLVGFPVSWMRNLTYVYVIFATTVIAIIFREKLIYLRRSMFLFDTIGIGLYTVIGIEKGLAADLPVLICIALGTMTACFGGVIRDILCNEIPVIFRQEIYATVCIFGGIVYFVLLRLGVPQAWVFFIAGVTVIVIRLLVVTFNFSLPSPYPKEKDEPNKP